MKKNITLILSLFLSVSSVDLFAQDKKIGSRQDREGLYNYLLEKTFERESFSPVKNQNLDLDIEKEMLKYKSELINAKSEEDLFYAIVKISNARKDRHLKVATSKNGLTLRDITPGTLPILFEVDFKNEDNPFFFISNYSSNIKKYGKVQPEVGDRLIKVNGELFNSYINRIKPYHRYSTLNGFWKKLPPTFTTKNLLLPYSFDVKTMRLEFENKDGKTYMLALPYLPDEKIKWQLESNVRYKGFELAYKTQTYHLYLPANKKVGKTVLLYWYGFRENLVNDIDRLIAYADSAKLLDHNIIVDATKSRGGSKGAYAVQRMSPLPFKTAFGNIRLSDIADDFINRKKRQFDSKKILDGNVKETIDDGSWLMDWLLNDVMDGINDGQQYSNNVPFKLAHLPKYSDGIMQPAEKHFTGKLACLFSPYGGSHLDQFSSIVVDNKLGYTIGMATGGYSNTWEWHEDLTFLNSKKPLVDFMWSIGHTIRPNGQILEGNPASIDRHIPLTRDNYLNYYDLLIDEALMYLLK